MHTYVLFIQYSSMYTYRSRFNRLAHVIAGSETGFLYGARLSYACVYVFVHEQHIGYAIVADRRHVCINAQRLCYTLMLRTAILNKKSFLHSHFFNCSNYNAKQSQSIAHQRFRSFAVRIYRRNRTGYIHSGVNLDLVTWLLLLCWSWCCGVVFRRQNGSSLHCTLLHYDPYVNNEVL